MIAAGLPHIQRNPQPAPGARARRWRAFQACCAAVLLAACGTPGVTLNSERIEQAFGSYGVEVLQAEDGLRVSSLYSGSGDSKVTRTFAVVTFAGRIPEAIAPQHARVLAGQSLGAVFKSAGWQIEKHNVFIGEMTATPEQQLLGDLMQIGLPQKVAVHVYWFVVRKDGRSVNYANIVEIHHPDYLSAADLRRLYGEVIFDDSRRTDIDDFVPAGLWKK